MALTFRKETTSQREALGLRYSSFIPSQGAITMRNLKILLKVVGAIQIVLGLAYLFAPATLLEAIGHTVPEDDIFYPLGMLAARFLAFGIAFIYISSDPVKHRLWISMMIVVQLVDLAVGIFYTATDAVSLADSLFPMFNAT
ncbi:hypothetical protein JYT71_01360, partial [Acidimicrobiaceae bacterium AH-315-P05]|nr:hypothetical protein [Acidimicrobiaceae bacterium AH-315-P05]